MPLAPDLADPRIGAIRRFNRFYTRAIGLLGEGQFGSPFTLAESRVLYELAHRDRPTASGLGKDLGLDPGYLSRILARFARQGFIARERSPTDGRARTLTLTPAGRAAFAPLDRTSQRQIAELIGPLPDRARSDLVAAMGRIETMLGPGRAPEPVRLRPHRPGDMGWVVHRHGALYAQEYGWDGSFEALVAEIVAGFVKNFDPEREACRIAELGGRIVGSVFVVRQSETVAKLRLLYVEPDARGHGIGRRLVEEAIAFARARGYATLTLWTNDVLAAARRIYVAAGFRLVASEPHRSFGKDLVGENWELDLTACHSGAPRSGEPGTQGSGPSSSTEG